MAASVYKYKYTHIQLVVVECLPFGPGVTGDDV